MSTNNKIEDDSFEATQVAEEQVAHLAANLLNDNAQHLNAVTLQRLTTARNLAVNQLAVSQAKAAHHVNQNGNVLQWLGHGFEQHRMLFSVLILGMLLLGFLVVQQDHFGDNSESSDAFLLASELPPEAFADKGFDKWLVSKRD